MHGLIALVVVVGWLAVSVLIARWIGKKISPEPLGMIATLILIPVLFVLPVADEIIGKFQFDRLCKEAEEVKIYGTVPVGEELYTAEGKWRLRALSEEFGSVGQPAVDESNRIRKLLELLIRSESIGPREINAAIPIWQFERRIYNNRTNEILASYRFYGTPGGLLSRTSFEKPIFVKPSCSPQGSGIELTRRILPFRE